MRTSSLTILVAAAASAGDADRVFAATDGAGLALHGRRLGAACGDGLAAVQQLDRGHLGSDLIDEVDQRGEHVLEAVG